MKTKDAVKHSRFGTQTKLADALGTYQSTVSEWGEYPPALYQLRIEAMTDLCAEPDARRQYPELAAAIRAAKRVKTAA